jgi:hypothetical protein
MKKKSTLQNEANKKNDLDVAQHDTNPEDEKELQRIVKLLKQL